MLGESPANCRQLFHRAKQYLAEHRHRFDASRETQLRLIGRFLLACQEGDVQGLLDILAQDVTSWGDGGRKAVAAQRPIYSAETAAHFWLALEKNPPANLALTLEDVNGKPAILILTSESLTAVPTIDA